MSFLPKAEYPLPLFSLPLDWIEMTEEESPAAIAAQLVKMDGKIDLLGAKMDAHRDLIMAKMEAGDRESGQAIALTNERVSTLTTKVTDNSARLTALEQLVDKDTKDRIETLEKVTEPVPLVVKLTFGFVAMVLIAVIGGLLALVINQ